MIILADTSPLLALAKVDALDLLRELYQQVITGPAVYIDRFIYERKFQNGILGE